MIEGPDYSKRVVLLILISTLLRLVFAMSTELSADEVYYWTYALKLQWNYFDHPPIVAFLIRLSTFNLLIHNALFVRLGAIVCSSISTWAIFKFGSLIKDERTGWFAALLFTSSIYCSISAGANILPDSPELVFWLFSLITLIKISKYEEKSKYSDFQWCLFGLFAGLSIMSKVHGIFLWFGALVYAILINKTWLKDRGIYLSVIISLVIISPLLIWNIQHNFISYRFHSNRVIPVPAELNILKFLKAVMGQVFMNNPINVYLICFGLFEIFKGKLTIVKKEIKIVLFCSLPLIMIVFLISFFKETYSHWSAPAFTSLLIFPAASLASRLEYGKQLFPKIVKWTIGYVIFIGLVQFWSVNYFPGTTSIQKSGLKTGYEDLTLYMYGWEKAGLKFDSLYKSDVNKKIMSVASPVVVTNWEPAASIEFYLTDKTKQQVIGIGDIADLHQYYYSNSYKKLLKKGDDAYFIVPSDSFYFRTVNKVFSSFKKYETAMVITQNRGGFLCRYITVYRLRDYAGNRK